MSSNKLNIIYDDISVLDYHTEAYLNIKWRMDVEETKKNHIKQKFDNFINDSIIFLKIWGYLK
jgi:t-SNARE complex subunit (syntaxin)